MTKYTVITREELSKLPKIPMGTECKFIMWFPTGEHHQTGYSLFEIYGAAKDGNVVGAFTRIADAMQIDSAVRVECVLGCMATVIFDGDSSYTCKGSQNTVSIKRVRGGVEEPGLLEMLARFHEATRIIPE